jgi:pimeloyl-ACP methyl ester carboxylesterase
MKHKYVHVNGLDHAYVEQGDGPMALLLHGFDTPRIFKYLMPAIADAGYRAVVPSMRGAAPSQVPPDGSMLVSDLVADANGLHEALGGDSDAVIIGQDWGAMTTWGAAAQAPERWAKVVVNTVPPLEFYGRHAADPERIKRYVHFYFFQMQAADELVAANDYAYLDWLYAHWTGSVPGYDSSDDLEAMRDTWATPERLRYGLELYRQNFPAATFGSEEWELARLLAELPTQPTLYLHGTEDPVMNAEDVAELVDKLPQGSDGAMIEGAGHFLLVENPIPANKRILEFLASERGL